MRHLLTYTMLFTLVVSGFAQTKGPKISFEETQYAFGKIKEQDGKVTHRFEFVNTGGSPLIIHNVTATCGCTASDWTRQPVAPGESGYVDATYNPAGRPGAFRKYVTVISNSNPGSIRLSFSGEVIPKPRSIEEVYRYGMGPLRLKSNHLSFGNVKHTATKKTRIEVINNSDEVINMGFQRVPAHVDIQFVPSTLKPGEKGEVIASFDAASKNDWGFVIDRVNVEIDGESARNYRLVMSANIEEDFSAYSSKELANAPVLKVDDPEFRFGKLNQGEKVEHNFVLTNEGESDLIIRKLRASCGCTAVQPEKKVIGPGESVKIKTIFNSAGKVGNQNKTITIITNDPQKSKRILWIKGEVVRKSRP